MSEEWAQGPWALIPEVSFNITVIGAHSIVLSRKVRWSPRSRLPMGGRNRESTKSCPLHSMWPTQKFSYRTLHMALVLEENKTLSYFLVVL